MPKRRRRGAKRGKKTESEQKKTESEQKKTESEQKTTESEVKKTSKSSGDESLEDTTIYEISDNVRGDLFERIVEKYINSHDCNILKEDWKKIIVAIEKDCVAILQRIINTSSSWSSKKFSLNCLKIGFDQYGFGEMWNMFSAKNDNFTAQDYADYMEKIKREHSDISTSNK